MISRSRLLTALIATCLVCGVIAVPAFAETQTTAWSPVAATGPTVIPPVQSEVQKLFVDAEGGVFTLTFGATTTAPIQFNAKASTVESALNALSSISGAGGSVAVTGGPGGHNAEAPYVIVFGGALANTDVAQLSPNNSLLTSGSGASVVTTVAGGGGTSKLALMAQNVGAAASFGTISYKAKLPSGITASAVSGTSWTCTASTPSEIVCTSSTAVAPGGTPQAINATLTAAPGAQSGVMQMEVTGGGASVTPTAGKGALTLSVSAIPASPGAQSFVAGAYTEEGRLDTRAGGHPNIASAAIFVNTVRSPKGQVVPAGEFRDIIAELPPGFLGNPIAVPQCPESTELSTQVACPNDTTVAQVQPVITNFGGTGGAPTKVYNTEAPYGYPAKFRFFFFPEVLNVIGELRSDEDYGLNAASQNTPQLNQVYGVFFTFWGNPASPAHNTVRGGASDVAESAFLTNATNCSEQESIAASNGGFILTGLTTTLWQNPGEEFRDSAGIPPVIGCENLHFEDNFTFEPSATKADSTASFKSSLTVPEEGLTDPTKLTTPELKDMVVQLPKGVVLNASGADGLQACSEQQIGYLGGGFPMPNPMHFNKDANSCPEASKIGTGELKSALLADPLHGALYLAAQGDGNPFGSLFALYLVIEDPRHGIFIKLPGEVEPDPQTGQMTVTFRNLPQLPFTRLDLSLKGGNRSALASPTTCGTYTTTATGTPWSAPESGPPTVTGQSFEINQGPDGGPCAKTPEERPFDLGWSAGAEGSQAGASGPFDFRITRPDGSQELESLELKTPKGLSASLKGIPYCTEAQIAQAQGSTGKQEQANSACPAASQVGTLTTAAGSGPTPFYVSGKAYLAGPYKGAPISVVAITPAVAGPFDLGNVVVRSAVYIDRTTAQVRAVTDPIPLFLKGVGLRIRDVRIHLDRKNWTINPTSCDASSVDLTAHGNSGAVANRSARFQVAGCDKLAFAPKLKAHLTGGTKRGKHPAFTAELSYPEGPGYANIKDVQVTIPHSEFLDQAHINTICTRPQAAAHQCPPGSIYGYAEAETPLIDGKLTGPVFLKSSDHQLPDLAIALRGPDNQPVEVEFQGRIDSIKGQIRNTIEGLPDVPVSNFVLRMKGGKKGLLVNSRDLCAAKVTRMTVDMTAQNNKTSEARPALTRSCKGSGKANRHGKHGKRSPGSRLSRLLASW